MPSSCFVGCGGKLTSADGGFQSPNYPFPYPHAAECTWLIQVSEGSAIRLLFLNFDIETHGFCEFDYLEVSASREHRRPGGRPVLCRAELFRDEAVL